MDGMSLLDVLRGVMLDPAEQAAYNADPAAYLGRSTATRTSTRPTCPRRSAWWPTPCRPTRPRRRGRRRRPRPDGDALGRDRRLRRCNGVEPPPGRGRRRPGAPTTVDGRAASRRRGVRPDGRPRRPTPIGGDGTCRRPGDSRPARWATADRRLRDAGFAEGLRRRRHGRLRRRRRRHRGDRPTTTSATPWRRPARRRRRRHRRRYDRRVAGTTGRRRRSTTARRRRRRPRRPTAVRRRRRTAGSTRARRRRRRHRRRRRRRRRPRPGRDRRAGRAVDPGPTTPTSARSDPPPTAPTASARRPGKRRAGPGASRRLPWRPHGLLDVADGAPRGEAGSPRGGPAGRG